MSNQVENADTVVPDVKVPFPATDTPPKRRVNRGVLVIVGDASRETMGAFSRLISGGKVTKEEVQNLKNNVFNITSVNTSSGAS
jgi:hypothetical protein